MEGRTPIYPCSAGVENCGWGGTVIAIGGGSCVASAASGSPRLTRPGTTLKLGRTAIVEFDTITPKGKSGPELQAAGHNRFDHGRLDLGLQGGLAHRRPKGRLPDICEGEDDEYQRQVVPHQSLDPANAVEAVVGNQLASSLIIAGYFPRCPDADTPSPFKAGQTFTTCETYMDKGKVTKIAYDGSSATLNAPIIWSS